MKDSIDTQVNAADPPVEQLVIDLDNVPDLDIAAMDMLSELQESSGEHGYTLKLVGATATVRDLLHRDGLDGLIADEDLRSTGDEAIAGPPA